MPEESTTPDPVERTRVFYETMDRDCDFDALGGFFTSDAVWNLTASHLGIYEGVAAIGDFLVGYWATWEDHHHEIEEILDLGHGVLLVAIREDGCPRGSNARVQARHLQVFQWVQGEIVRITGYPDIDEARAEARCGRETLPFRRLRPSTPRAIRTHGGKAGSAPRYPACRTRHTSVV
jgi:ketosteroid isomerase-like protein